MLLLVSIAPEEAFQQLVAVFGEADVRAKMRAWKAAHGETRDNVAVLGVWQEWKGTP